MWSKIKETGTVRGLERQTRTFEGSAQQGIAFLLNLFPLFAIFMNFTQNGTYYYARFMGYAVFLILILYPKNSNKIKRTNYLPWYDVLAAMSGLGAFLFFIFYQESQGDSGFISTEWNWELLVAVVGLLMLCEACRRILGPSILWVALFFFMNALQSGRPMARIIYDVFYGEQGVMGVVVGVCATYLILFGILATFLESIGVNDYFVSCAEALLGRKKGGAAKVEVLSSALCGMVSGSSVENTIITGSRTIPLMKKSGFSSTFAASVTASASLGGQIMPPILGSAAFMVAEFCNIPYRNLLLRAIFPAFLYFLGIYFMVHFNASKRKLGGVDMEDMPSREELINKSYLLLPVLVLVVLISLGFPVVDSVIFATFLCLLLGVRDKECPMDLARFCRSLERATKNILPVAVACGMAGVISGMVNTTGVGRYIISAVVSVSGYRLLIVLLFSMFCCLILGLAVPTVANYAIMASVCGPILTQGMGIESVSAHMFLLYFSMISDVTPPLSIASSAAAEVAKSNPFQTSCMASILSISAFIIPYMFVFHPTILLIDVVWGDLAFLLFTATVGMFSISAGIAGFLLDNLSFLLRCSAVLAGLFLMVPEFYSDMFGFFLVTFIFSRQVQGQKT